MEAENKNKNRILILIPAHNEGKNIGRVLEEIRSCDIADLCDILVINDGSKDTTVREVVNRGYACIDNTSGRGYGSALKAGYKYAFFHGYGHVLQMDADGQHDVSNIETLIRASRECDESGKGWDIIIGSRYMEGSVTYPVSAVRRAAVRFLSLVIRLATGQVITDPTSGLQIIRRRAYKYYTLPGRFDDDYPDANILIQMLLAGFRVKEIPAVMHERKEGHGMHAGFRPVLYMLKMSVAIPRVMLKSRRRRRREG